MTTMWDRFTTAVQAIDVACLDRAGLGVLAGEIGAARAVLDGLEARVAVGMRRLGASEASTAETLRRQTGCSAREAKHRARRAEILKKMPNVGEALSSGRLTGEHATALARAAAETSPEAVDRDAGLLAEAESSPADVASGKARDWVRRRQTGDDLQRLHQWQRRNRSLMFGAGEGGMIAGIAKFDQVSGAQFQNLVESLADRLYRADGGRDNPQARTRAQCRLDALLSLVGIEPALAPSPASTHANSHSATPDASSSPGPGSGLPAVGSGSGHSAAPNANSNPGSGFRFGSSRWRLWSRLDNFPVAALVPVRVFPVAALVPALVSPVAALVPALVPARVFPVAALVPVRVFPVAALVPARVFPVAALVPARVFPVAALVPARVFPVAALVPARVFPVAARVPARVFPVAARVPALVFRLWVPAPAPVRAGRPLSTATPTPGTGLGCSCGGGFGPKAQLCIVMDLEYLSTDGERGRCEIPGVGAMARSELERLGCDAEIYGLIFDGRASPCITAAGPEGSRPSSGGHWSPATGDA